jgi:alginate O-acetyltransferase complex protein AlgI
MLFDSPVYFLFLTVVVFTYWSLQRRAQNLLLLGASYFFYGWWDWRFLLLMAASTTIDFLVARRLSPTRPTPSRRLLLIVSLALNFTFLGFFKYFDFFVGSAADALRALGLSSVSVPLLQVVLPPGISFYTFQEVAYIVDVYKGKLEPADDFVDYALFISLFPHLIAGPIQRPSHLLPQVQRERRVDHQRIFDGLLLIASGLFRKCIIADNCALIANAAFDGRLGPPSFFVVLLGVYAFAWQIYGDFSGYSDIARGSAQLMGFHFMVNFRQPYLATSLQDFWRRWHISLSTWLRDYLYIPLGGSAHGVRRTLGNLMATMLLGGLWHGANWTFVIWGAIHGGGLALERLALGRSRIPGELILEPGRSGRTGKWAKRILIFHLVGVAWIFFRARSVSESGAFLRALPIVEWRPEYASALTLLVVFSLPLFLVDLALEHSGDEEYLFQAKPLWYRTALGAIVLVLLAIFSSNNANAFIYFQF